MLEIESKTQGAELISIKKDGKEYLHQGKEDWKRHAPVLFPIVGQIKNGETIIENQKYHMGQHGFARDMEFEEIEKSSKEHKYVLKSNKETLEKYPYKFELKITHKVMENSVETEYTVVNKDSKIIYFGLGGHPAFICEYGNENYELSFNKVEDKVRFYKLTNGLINDEESENIIEEGNRIKLTKDLFKEDAIIMKNLNSNKVILKENEKELLEFDFSEFPILAIWSKVGASFLCIEPWQNTADSVSSDGIFEHKENIIKLEPNKEFKCKYCVKIF